MTKVQFIHRSGRVERMEKRYASILQGLGRGTYMTRDMRADAPAVAVVDDVDSMTQEQLHALARELGVKVHHKAGADKVRAALREAAK